MVDVGLIEFEQEIEQNRRIALVVVNAHDLLCADGGASISLTSETVPSTGYMVGGAFPETVVRTCTYQTIERFIREHLDVLALPDYFLGLWDDSETGKTHLDVSQYFYDEAPAILTGRCRNEISIWDIANNREIRL